jgi:hypothetical protein
MHTNVLPQIGLLLMASGVSGIRFTFSPSNTFETSENLDKMRKYIKQLFSTQWMSGNKEYSQTR